MKRILATVFLILLVLSPFYGVSYAETEYTDSESGVTFTIPDGWNQETTSDTYKTIKARFTIGNEAKFLYGYTDVYATMPEELKKSVSRADLTNDFFSKEDIGDLINLSPNIIMRGQYSGLDYYYANVIFSDENGKGKIIMRFDNGYMFSYEYIVYNSSTSFTKRTKECEAIMSSVTYPRAKNEKQQNMSPQVTKPSVTNKPIVTKKPTNVSSNSKSYRISYTGLSIMALFVLIIVVWVVSNTIKRKKRDNRVMNSLQNDNANRSPITYAKESKEYISQPIDKSIKTQEGSTQNNSFDSFSHCENEDPAKNIPVNNSIILESSPEENQSEENVKRFCRKCGNRLLPDSVYCDRCGTRVQ